ncbi:transposase [Frigidibacter mobilis]|uniref:Transposase n=1 Tax=Frigidibacter mobilis TaxID=1335048 RepID=A0A159Z2G7_9RHOB|nr:transposase [Frigidibacter mobilis]
MSELYWLTDAQMDRLRPFFPKSRGKPRVDDRRVLSGIIFVQRNGLMWKHAPSTYGPPKTLYSALAR